MAEPDIRPARPADLPGILALYRQLNPDDPVPDADAAGAAWSALLSSGLTTPFVVEVAGQVVSSCTLAIVPNLSRGARPYGVIENMVTHADHRRAGLGRAVLHAALDKAWSADCYKVLLATGSRQESTLRFYEGAGSDEDAGRRVGNPDRVERRKITSIEGLARFNARSNMAPVPRPGCLLLDTGVEGPDAVARNIIGHFALDRTGPDA